MDDISELNKEMTPNFDSLEELDLDKSEIYFLHKYREYIEPYSMVYPREALQFQLGGVHPLKHNIKYIMSVDDDRVTGTKEQKIKLIKELFNSSNCLKSFGHGGESKNRYQHQNILYNARLLYFIIQSGFDVSLLDESVREGNNKNPEFSFLYKDCHIHIEAKQPDRYILDEIVYSNPDSNGDCKMDDKGEQEIKERFRKVLKKAKSKFKGTDRQYIVAIDIHHNVRCMGSKLITYLNGIVFDEKFLGILLPTYDYHNADKYDFICNEGCELSKELRQIFYT